MRTLFVAVFAAASAVVVHAQCTFSLSPAGVNIGAAATTGTISIAGAAGCSRTAVSNASWLTITFGQSGTGSGSAGWAAERNTTAAPRTGTLAVAGQVFTVTQSGANCLFELDPAAISLPVAGGAGSFRIKTTCSWTAVPGASWIAVNSGASGVNDGFVQYTVGPNTAVLARSGQIRVVDQAFTISQAGAGCSYQINPRSAAAAAAGGPASVAVATDPICSWVATSNVPWIRTSGPAVSRTGPGAAEYTVEANTATGARSGTLTIATQTFTVNQSGAAPQITAVVNSASYAPGAVAPGEIVAVFGTTLGPAQLAEMQLTPDGQSITAQLAGTRVLFDGDPAPLVYTRADVVSAVVPFGVERRGATRVEVEYQGIRSNAVTVNVQPAAPGLYTLDSSGSGPGAIRNSDYSVNSADNPAERGAFVMLYGTGGGQTDPAFSDGRLATGVAYTLLPPTVTIGGIEARLYYVGAAPTLVAGALQINVEIPAGITPGPTVPVLVRLGEYTTQPGVTVAVK